MNAYYYLKHYKKEMILGPIFKMLEVLFELIIPFIMAYIIDVGISYATSNNDYSKIYIPALLIFGLSILGFLSTLVCQYFASVASQGYGTELRNALYKKVCNLSNKEIDQIGKGNLVTLITSDVNRLQVSVAMMVRLVLRAPALVLGSLICAFIIDYQIAFIFLAVVVLISIILFFVIWFSSKKNIEVQKRTDEIVTITNDSLNGIRVSRAFNNQNYEISKYKNKTKKYFDDMKIVMLLNALTNPLTFLVINVAIVLIVYFSSSQIVLEGTLTTGDLTSLISYLNQMFAALVVVSNLVVIFTKAFSSKKRVEDLLNKDSSIINDPKFHKIEIDQNEDLITFKNAAFKYNEDENEVVSDLNFTIKKGQTIGIIGGTGSGKTTIIKLIERFFDVTNGEIIYKGHNIKEYDLKELRNEISLVNQKAVLFKGTIKSNLLMGKNEATEEEMWNALKEACAYEFVKKYHDGLEHEVNEKGLNFSGGQRQRLSIARSLLKNAEVLILDDSTSALDYLTEKELRDNLNKKEEVTKIIIAQRVSSLMNADQIIVMHHGKIAGIGNHETLLKTSTIYKEIYDSQVGN